MSRTHRLILALIALIALILRLAGIHHGYPDYVSGDERLLVKEVVHFFDNGTLEPNHYNYPAFFSYLYAGTLYLARALGGLDEVGGMHLPMGFAVTFNIVLFALIGRILSVLAGIALVAVTYLIGRQAYDRHTALGGAFFVAISATLINHSRFALPEITMALLAVLACYFLVRLVPRPDYSNYLLAGLCAGLAISTKYNAAMILGGLLAAHYLAERTANHWRHHLKLLAAGTACLGAFLLGSPYWLFSFGEYFQAFLNIKSNTQFSLYATSWPWLGLLKSVWNAEWIWGLLATAGCIYALYRRTAPDCILLAIILPAFFYIGSWAKADLHYIIFLAPLAGLLAARLALEIMPRLQLDSRYGLALLAFLSLPNIYREFNQGHELARQDVRLQAARWIEANIPDNSVIGGYWISYLPPLKGLKQREKLHQLMDDNRHIPQAVDALRRLDRNNSFYKCVRLHYFMNDPQIPPPYQQTVDPRDPKTRRIFCNAWLSYEDIRRFGVEYVLLSNAAYGRFFDGSPPPMGTAAHYFFTRSRAFIEQFFESANPRYQLVKEFVDDGTRISLFKVMPAPTLVTVLDPGRISAASRALQ